MIAFGAWQMGDPEYWGANSVAEIERTVGVALDGGVNLFDTAEMYGNGESERMLGKVLGARRKDIYIASKVSPEHCTPEKLREACEASLQRLNTDYIDLYQIHWPFRDVPFAEAQVMLEQLREEGKIRYFGLSNFGKTDLSDWLDTGEAISNQLGYNLLFRAPEYEIIPHCQRSRMGVLAYMPLMQGLLSGRWRRIEEIPVLRRRTRHFSSDREGTRHNEPGCEALLIDTLAQLRHFSSAIGIPEATIALNWLLVQPGITSTIVGGSNANQMQANIDVVHLDLGPAATVHLNELTFSLKQHFGANADLWLGETCSRVC